VPIAPKDWELMQCACTDNNKDMYDGHLPGPLDGSLRDDTAIAAGQDRPFTASCRPVWVLSVPTESW
jgi:hypothetical protein